MNNYPKYGYCPKCSGRMKKGIALQNIPHGIPDFPNGEVVTISYSIKAKIIPAAKCSRCGYSVTI